MSKPETWVQMYDPPIEPGPDGAPVDVSKLFHPLYLGQSWHGNPPFIERTTSRDIPGGRITRRWRRYLVRRWEDWADF